MICHGCTKLLISPLIIKFWRHMRYQRIASFLVYVLILSIVFYDMGHTRDRTLKTTLHYFHILFLNSDISGNVCLISAKFLENIVYFYFRRKRVSKF